MSSLRIFHIQFVDRRGGPSRPDHENSSDAIPVIEVALFPPGTAPNGNGIRCRALVDTGADHWVVSRRILESLAAPVQRTMELSGSAGARDTTVHDLDIALIPTLGAPLLINADATLQEDAFVHSAYPVIVPRNLLRHGVLVMDYPQGVFEWRYLGN